MLRIFRRIRGDALSASKPRTYLLYALGEVLLVTVGILIALEVNNWNEERIEQRQIAEYAHALISDLERDIAMVEPINRQMQRTLDVIDTMGTYTRGKNLDQISNLDLYYLVSSAGYRPYQWHRAAVEQLKNSGALRNIKNASLVVKITAYDSLTHHLDDDYAMDHEIWFEATKLANEVVDSNYPIDDHAMEVMLTLRRSPYTFPAKSLHELYQDIDLQLLTDDMNHVRVLVNKFASLGNIKAHTDQEIPTLLESARELVVLLNIEYPP
jgi:Family of unknown function (DUF6090)